MFLKYINLGIALALCSALVVIYWYAYRPLPSTSGTVSAFISDRAAISRDALGVPHIRAGSEEDALFLQGYATAQDRLWQIDGIRRLAGGDLAEIFGPSALESDREARRLRLRRIAEAAYVSLPPNTRNVLASYVRGINFFMQTHRDRLPLEFSFLRYDPRPWSVVDSILVGLHMFRTLTTTWQDEIKKRNMLIGGDPAKVNFLLPARTGSEVQPGSNAWAVSGSRTSSGKPLLANDMHLDFSIPGIWYMVHIQAPGLNVAGVSLPGMPGVIVGHNDRIAWGVTNLHFDVQDLYLEQFDDNTGRYVFEGRTEQARGEREVIRVKGAATMEVLNWVTRHGPIFLAEGQQRMALRWVGAEPGGFQFPFVPLNRARNWQEFTAALSTFPGPAQNFVYADIDGNIGYHAAGRLPVRTAYLGDVPVDGTSAKFDWNGFIPFEQLPSAYNPVQGLIVTANQNPFPADYPYSVNGNFASHYRSKQIRDMLESRKGWRAADMLGIQTDVYSGFSQFLARAVVSAYDKRHASNPDLADAIALLRVWNGQMEKDQAAPLIVALVYQHLSRAVSESASPGKGIAYETQMAPPVLETLLRRRPPGWFRDYDETLLRTLDDAVAEGRRMQGRQVNKWLYGKYLQLLIAHPLGHRLPLVSKYFDIGPVPMSGSSTTVKQTTRRMGPSMRMAVDLSDLDGSFFNITTGESGQILSSHYKDQWDAYYSGRSFPMQFEKVQANKVLEFYPEGGKDTKRF